MEQEKSLFVQSLFDISATEKERVGTVRKLEDGREFVYAKAGAVALVQGNLLQSAAPVANHTNIAVQAAAAVGDKVVNVTLGATAVVADYYKDGFLNINDAAGEGTSYKIKGHKANAGSGTLVVQLYDAVRVALTTSSEATLVCNPAANVIQCPATTLTGAPAGVAIQAVTALYYFWMQVKGPSSVLISACTIGLSLEVPCGTAGAVTTTTETTFGVVVGVALVDNADTEHGLVMLAIPGY